MKKVDVAGNIKKLFIPGEEITTIKILLPFRGWGLN
jgi:hypothetical protein